MRGAAEAEPDALLDVEAIESYEKTFGPIVPGTIVRVTDNPARSSRRQTGHEVGVAGLSPSSSSRQTGTRLMPARRRTTIRPTAEASWGRSVTAM